MKSREQQSRDRRTEHDSEMTGSELVDELTCRDNKSLKIATLLWADVRHAACKAGNRLGKNML